MAIDLNLEIIVGEKQTLLAFRNDLPDDMMHMVINAGHWQIFNEEKISSEVLVKVRTEMVVGLKNIICLN